MTTSDDAEKGLSSPTVPAESSAEGYLHFGVDARHVRQLGQQLVGDRITALTELVKNAYDADATLVTLRFDNAGQGAVTIADNGAGMTFEEIRNNWMRISSDNKERNSLSPRFSRPRAGRKGIGRFSAESLGDHLTMTTTVAGEPFAHVLDFNWKDDYDGGHDLAEVSNRWRRVAAPADSHGTTLDIRDLHDLWTAAQRQRVTRALILLQPPFDNPSSQTPKVTNSGDLTSQVTPRDTATSAPSEAPTSTSAADPGFRVDLVVEGEEQPTTGLAEFFAGATARFTADIAADGTIDLHVIAPRFGFDRREQLSGHPLPGAGPFSIYGYYFIYRSGAIGIPVRQAQAMGHEYGGVRVYRDGLRMLPYGEPSNDWLGLDEFYRSRSTLLAPIGNQNLFAQVLVTREANPSLIDTASREGLLKNAGYEDLVKSARTAIIEAATWIAEVRNTKISANAPREPRQSRREILDKAAADASRAIREAVPTGAAGQAIRALNAALEVATSTAEQQDRTDSREQAALLGELELLRILSSLGTSIAVFSHEVRATLNANAIALAQLQDAVAAASSPLDPALLQPAREAVNRLADLSGYIDGYVSQARRRDRSPLALDTCLRQFVEGFAQTLAPSVVITTSVSPLGLRTLDMSRSALDAVLINLFTNAIKAMDADLHGTRRVGINAIASDGDSLTLTFQDTGRGIDPRVASRLFEAFVTTALPTSDSELGVGTGLGLKVVSDIVDEYGGTIAVGHPDEGFSTSIAITLPRWSAQIGSAGAGQE